MSLRRLCAAAEIPEGAGRGFAFGGGTARQAIFVIRWQGQLLAYRNECPHVGAPIDWPENRFFDTAGKYLMCGMHGAVFRPEDGLCIDGPCRGRSLAPVALRLDQDEIFMIEA